MKESKLSYYALIYNYSPDDYANDDSVDLDYVDLDSLYGSDVYDMIAANNRHEAEKYFRRKYKFKNNDSYTIKKVTKDDYVSFNKIYTDHDFPPKHEL